MSLSDQIKQPGQIIGSGGGGGGTTDAGDLTTGTLAAARLPGVLANVDTQAELLSAAAAAAASHTHAASDIASGTVATARLGSGTADNTTFLRGDQTWAAPSDATKLPLAGGTMTGAVSFSGSISSAGSSTRNIHGNGGTTDLYANVPTGGVWGVSVNGNSQGTLGTGGLQFPTAHGTPATSVYGVFRNGDNNSITVQGPIAGYSIMGCNNSSAPRIVVGGTGASFYVGSIAREPSAVSLAAAGTRTVMASATTKSGTVTVINATDGKRATFSVENGTPVKIEGDASFVAGAPGSSQIGLELSSPTLQIKNGYAGAKLIAFDLVLA